MRLRTEALESTKSFYSGLGENIKKKRIEADMSQMALAVAVDSTLMTIYRWERGLSHISIFDLLRLCWAFGCTLQEILPEQ